MVMERTPSTEVAEILLGGKPYRVVGEVRREYTNLFARKVNQGDPGPDDHPTFSTAIQRSWMEGALVNDQNPASDSARFRFSTAETQYAGALSLAPYTFEYEGPAGETATPWVVGDFNEYLHIAWGQNLYKRDVVAQTWSPIVGLTGSVTSHGVVYREQTTPFGLYFFIPTSNGYHVLDTTGSITVGTDTDPVIEFCVWSDKLFKLMGDGSLWYATKLPAVAGDWTRVTAIPDGGRPRRLFRFYNKANEPCLMVITDSGGWKLDFANSMMHQDDLEFPRHPEMGRAALQHHSTGYISVGNGVWRYDNNVLSPMGLDGRDGLPQEFRGFIVDFASAQNGLYALIQGQAMEDTGVPDTAELQTGSGGLSFSMEGSQTRNLVMIHNGFGWHYRWDGQGASPTNIHVSNAQNLYTVWWGSGSKIYMQVMPRTYFNPDDPDTRGYPFRKDFDHEQPWYAYGWLGQDKIGKEIEVAVDKLTNTGGWVEIMYKIDNDDHDWVLLGRLTEDGEYSFPLGLDPDEPVLRGGILQYRGVRHRRIKLRFRGERGDDMEQAPIIKWHSIIARRWLRPVRFWRMRISLTEKIKDYTTDQQLSNLIELSLRQEAVVFEHGDKKFMAEIVVVDGPESTGRDTVRYVDVTLMESTPLGLNSGHEVHVE